MTESEEKELMAADGLEPISVAPVGHANMSSDSIGGTEPIAMPEMSAEEEASKKFTMLLPYVAKLSAAMPSQKGLTRVLHAFAEFPFGAQKPRLLTEAERQLFHVLQEIQGCKSTVMQAILKRNYELEQLKKQATTELPVIENKEVTDGGN